MSKKEDLKRTLGTYAVEIEAIDCQQKLKKCIDDYSASRGYTDAVCILWNRETGRMEYLGGFAREQELESAVALERAATRIRSKCYPYPRLTKDTQASVRYSWEWDEE